MSRTYNGRPFKDNCFIWHDYQAYCDCCGAQSDLCQCEPTCCQECGSVRCQGCEEEPTLDHPW